MPRGGMRAIRIGVIAMMAVIVLAAGENSDTLVEELPELDATGLGALLVKRGLSESTWGDFDASESVEAAPQAHHTAMELNLAETMWNPSEELSKISQPEPEFVVQPPHSKKETKKAKETAKKAKRAKKKAKEKAKAKKAKKKAKAKKAAKKAKKAAALKIKQKKAIQRAKRVMRMTKKVSSKSFSSIAGGAAANDPIARRLSKARHDVKMRKREEDTKVAADKRKVAHLTKRVKMLTTQLATSKHNLVRAKAALLRHRDLLKYDLGEFKKISSQEAHRKHLVNIQAAIRRQRQTLRRERAKTTASNERLRKYLERKKRLGMNWSHYLRMARKRKVPVPPAQAAHKRSRAAHKRGSRTKTHAKHTKSVKHRAMKGHSSHKAKSGSVAKAVAAVQKALKAGELEKELRPKVAQLRGLLSGPALRTAVSHVVAKAVASKVDKVFKNNPAVRATIARAVTKLTHKLNQSKASSTAAAKRKALAKAEAAAAVKKVKQAQAVLNKANSKLSRALKKHPKGSLSLEDIALLQGMLVEKQSDASH